MRFAPGEPVRILAIRDEFVSRTFDEPGSWWPGQPGIVGGRDRLAGGTWCATDVAAGATALVLNRVERHTGTPSRGVLPLTALRLGEDWPAGLDHREMASFTLVYATPGGVTAWAWDAQRLRRHELGAGTHVITSRGLDQDEEKAARWAPQFASRPWLDVVTERAPVDDRTALVVRHEFETDTYATVFGQLITARPGRLDVSYSSSPWDRASWTSRQWPADKAAPPAGTA